MTNFDDIEVGDFVEQDDGTKYPVTKVDESAVWLQSSGGYNYRYLIRELKTAGWVKGVIKKDKDKKMSKIKLGAMMKRLLSTEIQTLVKAGLINGDLELTTEGNKVLSACLFDQFKDKLVAEAQAMLDEQKADKED